MERAARRTGKTCRGRVAGACRATVFIAALAVAGAGCGGGGGSSGEPQVLFDGTAAELLPHETGRSAAFRSTATGDSGEATAQSVETVVANNPDGTFVTDEMLENGERARIEARDTGNEIGIERAVVDPDTQAAQTIELDPPAVIVRTPVIAGDRIQTRFVRVVDVAIDAGGETVRVRVPLVGDADRTPVDLTAADVPAGHFDGAIRYRTSARASASIPLGAGVIQLTADVAGEELIAPGVGVLRETLDLRIRAGGSESRAQVVSERLPSG